MWAKRFVSLQRKLLCRKKSFVFDDAYIQEPTFLISLEADAKLQKLTRDCISESNDIRLFLLRLLLSEQRKKRAFLPLTKQIRHLWTRKCKTKFDG